MPNRKAKAWDEWDYEIAVRRYWGFLWLVKYPCVTYCKRKSGLSDAFAWATGDVRYKVIRRWFDLYSEAEEFYLANTEFDDAGS